MRPAGYLKRQSLLWFPVLRDLGFTNLKLRPLLKTRLEPELRALEGTHALGTQGNKRYVFALRSLRYEPDDYWRRVYQRQVSFGFSTRQGMPSDWSDLFRHGMGTRYYGYGWRTADNEALDAWAFIDVAVLGQLGANGVPLSTGKVNRGQAQSFVTLNLRQLRDAARPAELVPYHSQGHPAFSGMPFAYDG